MENNLSTWQGFCPGLTHGQKFGISYGMSADTQQNMPTNERKSTGSESHSATVPNENSDHSQPVNKKNNEDFQESDGGESKSDYPQE